ncbi:MAG: protoheme IX farnesyltransferase [Pantoea sp. Brub]|nr:protoheme IX farnesyltransferase [Pantoea sp. Brub]
MFKKYLELIKLRIILGNLISVIGGYFLASKDKIINYMFVINLLLSVALVIASSCILNNIIDRDIDRKMERTKNRVLVKGLISIKLSIMYASILAILGFYILLTKINFLSACLAFLGFIIYVFIYSAYMKRYSIYSTIVGSFSGAVPPIIGYCAVTNKIDICVFILFIMFSIWQIPHSYAIAILFVKDYQTANIPLLPLVKGIHVAKNHIIFYILAFIVMTFMLTLTGYTGYIFLIVSLLINLFWLSISLLGYKTSNNQVWAKKVFIVSILVITTLSLMMSLDSN